MSDPTPGEWRATKHTDTKGWTVSAGGNSIASVKPRPEAEANAWLFAAAKEQRAALVRMCAVMRGQDDDKDGAMAAAAAAIAKGDVA